MVELKYTAVQDLPKIREELKATFKSGKARPLEWRKQQLRQVARMVQDNAEAFIEAELYDLGKPAQETYMAEVGPVIDRALQSADKLEEWAKPETVQVPDWQKSWQPTLNKNPKGVVLIISPWNYPLILSLQPLIAAISAGCCAVLKPSELAPAFSTTLAELVPRYLDQSAYRIVNGGVDESTKLLELQWDHIFYTGNGRVAKIIAAAAAKHLTPCSFELGGKSPVIIDPSYDIDLAAKRVLWGKCNNAGQICVAPDYVLVPEDKQDELVAAMKKHHDDWFPEGALESKSFGHIVSDAHHARLNKLLKATKGQVAFGGKTGGKRGMEPTVVKNVKDGDSLMSEELFGPILPIVPVKNTNEAIEFINAHEHPLVLYAFSENPELKQQILAETMSGNVAFNDTFQQLAVNELPFTGVGDSGYGMQVMKYGFDGFTHTRASVDIPKEAEEMFKIRYAPYTDKSYEAFKGLFPKVPAN